MKSYSRGKSTWSWVFLYHLMESLFKALWTKKNSPNYARKQANTRKNERNLNLRLPQRHLPFSTPRIEQHGKDKIHSTIKIPAVLLLVFLPNLVSFCFWAMNFSRSTDGCFFSEISLSGCLGGLRSRLIYFQYNALWASGSDSNFLFRCDD